MDDNADKISLINMEFRGVEPELKAAVHRDWGLHYKRLNLWKPALKNFDDALEINPTFYRPLLEKGICYLGDGNVTEALACAQSCVDEYPKKLIPQQHRNNCIYEQNQFEKSLCEYCNTRHRHPKGRRINDGPELVDYTISNAIGYEVGPCLHNLRKDIDKYHKYKLTQHVDDRPMWKILKQNGECDVVSIRMEKKPYIPPMAKFRRQRKNQNLHTMYFDSQTAKDIVYLQNLKLDKRLNLVQTPESSKKMLNTINDDLARILDWETMLYTRKPVYAKMYTNYPEKTEATHQGALNYIQYQTRRDAFHQLETIQKLSKTDFDGMLQMVESVMSEFYSIKTKRVFPRKFEFISEILNIVALAYVDRLAVVPTTLMLASLPERLHVLLQIPPDHKDEAAVDYPFGDKRGFVDPDAPDVAYFSYKRKVFDMEKRLQRCTYPIERCYLCHELCNLHMSQRKLDEPKNLAVKLIDQAMECGNYAWLFLGCLDGIKADVAISQLTGARKKLDRLLTLKSKYNEFVVHFMNTMDLVHEDLTTWENMKNS